MSHHYLDVHFPDHDHLKHFPDDANAYDVPQRRVRRSRRSCSLFGNVRPGVYLVGMGLGFAVAIVIALSGCATDSHGNLPVGDERATPENKAKRHKLMRDLHQDFDKARRTFRMP